MTFRCTGISLNGHLESPSSANTEMFILGQKNWDDESLFCWKKIIANNFENWEWRTEQIVGLKTVELRQETWEKWVTSCWSLSTHLRSARTASWAFQLVTYESPDLEGSDPLLLRNQKLSNVPSYNQPMKEIYICLSKCVGSLSLTLSSCFLPFQT